MLNRTKITTASPHLRRGGRGARPCCGTARHAVRAMFAETQAHGTLAAVPTVRSFAPAFLADCAERWKPATRRAHADGTNRYILPNFSDRRVDSIAANDLHNWLDDLSAARAGSANRALAVPSSMLWWARRRPMRTRSPTS